MKQAVKLNSRNERQQLEAQKNQAQTDHERRRQIRGLTLLAVAAIVFAILRFGVHRVFPPGWWRLW